MEIIVGSTALKEYGLNRNEPVDIDIWSDNPIEDKVDSAIIPLDILFQVPFLLKDDKLYATPDAVYTIKISHAVYPIKWQKTKLDILWLKSKGCKILPELYALLKQHWKEIHGNKDFLSLMKNKEQFFTDNVPYVYEHDYLHELVAYPNKPIYTNCLKDGQEVFIDKDKFFSMSFENQVRMFTEEIVVIACERWLINPYWKGKVSWYKAYMLSLEKTVTQLTKGWASEFMVENLEYFVKPQYSYFKHILNILNLDGGNPMSNVDMQVFEDFKEALKNGESIETFIYELCEGDTIEFDSGIKYPDRGTRTWKDESWVSEYQTWREHNKKFFEKVAEEFGYQHLEQDGGGKGGSEYCYGVFKLKDKIYKAAYSYYSYSGHHYDDILSTLREVTPVEKTITIYE